MSDDLFLPRVGEVRPHLATLRDHGLLPPGSLHMLLGDFHGFAKLAVFVDDVPPQPPDEQRRSALHRSLQAISELTTVSGAALAVSRAGPSGIGADDLRWRDAMAAATELIGLENHGVYVVTSHQVGRIGGATSAAA